MAETTDGTGTETPTVTPAETVTPPASDSAGSGYQQRIDGLVAERNTAKGQRDDLQKRLETLEEKHKTDSERALDSARREAVDQFKDTDFNPVKQRLEALTTGLETSLGEKMKGLSDEQKSLIPDSLPIEEKHAQVDRVLSLKAGKTTVGAAANPGEASPNEVIAGSAFREWQSLDKYTVEGRKRHYELLDKMNAAYKEQRIDFSR